VTIVKTGCNSRVGRVYALQLIGREFDPLHNNDFEIAIVHNAFVLCLIGLGILGKSMVVDDTQTHSTTNGLDQCCSDCVA